MKKKFRFTMSVEIEVDSSMYPEGSTDQEMLEIEKRNFSDDPFMFLSRAESNCSVEFVE